MSERMDPCCPKLEQASSYEHIRELQNLAIREHSKRLGRPLSILEAGCGQCWPLDLTGVAFILTGIDLDPVALEMRKSEVRDLDVAIHGDLCCAELPEASFDVIFSSFVLEHVERADLALKNFAQWLKPGGILLLSLPDRNAVHGFYARLLPFWVHLWCYRHVKQDPLAGTPGYAPYATYYHPVIGREQLFHFLADHDVRLVRCYGDAFLGSRPGLLGKVLRAAVEMTALLSLGSLAPDSTDIVCIAVKNDPAVAKEGYCAGGE
jgi:SAM-dependent methyltransferase